MNGVAETYAYDSGDKLQSVSVGGNPIKTYGYDAAGRTTSVTSSAGTTTLTYDFESRITQIAGPGINATYSYNGLDTRVGKTENSVSNTFRRSGAYVTDPVLGDGSASYTPGVSVRSGGNVRYQHAGLKNTDSQTSPAQSVAASRIYDAFGNVVSSSGTWTGPFGYAGNFGYQQDASGLKLLGHRYYDPSTGRFLTRDPIKDGRNWYAYGAGESAPTTIADPSGLADIKTQPISSIRNGDELIASALALLRRSGACPELIGIIVQLLADGRILVGWLPQGHALTTDDGRILINAAKFFGPHAILVLAAILLHEAVHIRQQQRGQRRGTDNDLLEAEAYLTELFWLFRLVPGPGVDPAGLRRERQNARDGLGGTGFGSKRLPHIEKNKVQYYEI